MISMIVTLRFVPPIISLAILRLSLGKVNAKLFFCSMALAYLIALLFFVGGYYVQ